MHTRMKLNKTLLWSLIFFGILGLSTSCEEEDTRSQVRVRVMNQDSVPIQNALVRLFAPGTNTLFTDPNTQGSYYRYSGVDGWCEPSFKFDGEAFLDVEAAKGGWRGCSYVHVTKASTAEIIVFMKPYGDLNNGCPQ
ncbi:MAG: hypothetical protein EBZ34_02630 [Flavobacteriia bacterium]|nr:hypothetical protein [Flavobacteriia bacterium]